MSPSKNATPISAAAMGSPLGRVDAREKVTGRATYAFENDAQFEKKPLYLWLVTSTTAKGRVREIDASAALEHPGVTAVLDHVTAPRMADTDNSELAILQDDRISYYGQIVALVLAETIEAAREGARLTVVHQDEEKAVLTADEAELYTPTKDAVGAEPDTEEGDVDAALAEAEVVVDKQYSTPYEQNNPLEPHAASAVFADGVLEMWDSTQGVHGVASALAPMLGLSETQIRVQAPYVGGGFGSKGVPHPPEMAVALAAVWADGRPVKLAVTRQQMYSLTGYRTATKSHIRLGARADGRITALDVLATVESSAVKEFVEHAAKPARMMYAGANRRTRHRVAELDVAIPSWLRAPGEMPAIFALEVAMDELAEATGIDPVELRILNDPEIDPETGKPFASRRLVECLRRGAESFGWSQGRPEPRSTLEGDWWVGTGVASSTYPANFFPGNSARVTALEGGRYNVAIGAADIGTGSRTALLQIAADALEVPVEDVDLAIADSSLPTATVAGGSSGTGSWGTAIVQAAQQFRADHGDHPVPGELTTSTTEAYPDMDKYSMHSFGAAFAEVRVHRLTGEIRVPRLTGVYSVGRVINPVTARSQLLGALIMAQSAALYEEAYRDTRTGHFVTQDLASYHVAAHADIGDLHVEWLDDVDERATPMGSRGIGEIGNVGASAAIVNAAYHATGVRVRDLPATPENFL